MTTDTKPTLVLNLASTLLDSTSVRFPKYASPKYDGIRCVIIGGQAWSRNMILIPNKTVQAYFADGMCDGMDGELLSGPHDAEVFKRTSSIIRAIKGSAAWHFKVFDYADCDLNFAGRLQKLRDKICYIQDAEKHKVSLVIQTLLHNGDDLLAYEEGCLSDGYEGVMLRNPSALYKNGRSTALSQDLLKVKRFEDSEAIVLGWEPLVNIRGETQQDMMGSLRVKDAISSVEFSIGSGFDIQERKKYASSPPIGQTLTYQYFAQGAYTKPRFPTFKGFRPAFDVPGSKV